MLPILGLLYLLVFLVLGFLLQHATDAPIPASVLGMLCLLVFLLIKGSIPESLKRITQILSPLLPLFLIPVSAGIMTQQSVLQNHGLLLLGILAISIVPGALVAGFIMQVGRK